MFRARKEHPGWWKLSLPRAGDGRRGALKQSCGFHLPHLQASAATLRRCLGRATAPKVFCWDVPWCSSGRVQWELDLLLLWKIPRIPEYLTKPTASLLLQAFSQNPSSLNTTAWQCPGHSHCEIWPPPVWGQLITSIWRYRLLNLSLLAKDLLFLLNFHRSLQRNSRSQRLRVERSAFPARAGFARLL